MNRHLEYLKEAWNNDVFVALMAAFVGGFGFAVAGTLAGAGAFLISGFNGVLVVFLGVAVAFATYVVGMAIFTRAERLRSLRWERGDWR